jgi:hypothetical protein
VPRLQEGVQDAQQAHTLLQSRTPGDRGVTTSPGPRPCKAGALCSTRGDIDWQATGAKAPRQGDNNDNSRGNSTRRDNYNDKRSERNGSSDTDPAAVTRQTEENAAEAEVPEMPPRVR